MNRSSARIVGKNSMGNSETICQSMNNSMVCLG
jgi:hypothetical protein